MTPAPGGGSGAATPDPAAPAPPAPRAPLAPSADALARFARRRERLLADRPDAVLLLPAAPPARRAADIEYRYRPEANLYYLTGWCEPHSLAVLRGLEDREGAVELSLFTQPRDEDAERWTGPRLGPEGARTRFGADAAYPIGELSTRLPELLLGATTLYYDFGRDRGLDDRVFAALDSAHGLGRRRHLPVPDTVTRPARLLGAQRVIKDPSEQAALRRACETTVAGHLAAMRATRPGLGERDLEAVLELTFRRLGAEGPANPSIVGAGAHATVLHYDANHGPLRDGDLVLVDAGAEQDHYAGDVTRTYPVGGRFGPAQRRVYEIVLAAQRAAIDAVHPGTTLGEIHRVATLHLIAGLCELGVLAGEPEELLEAQAHRPFYPHRTCHWLGLDVHDLGPTGPGEADPPLAPGMVLTVEPGLYFPAAPSAATAEAATREGDGDREATAEAASREGDGDREATAEAATREGDGDREATAEATTREGDGDREATAEAAVPARPADGEQGRAAAAGDSGNRERPADRPAADVPADLRGLGVRIEDDVLVTPGGCEVLTAGVPKEVEAVEATVGAVPLADPR
jgi:Xaa-Pro aminopeptidase